MKNFMYIYRWNEEMVPFVIAAESKEEADKKLEAMASALFFCEVYSIEIPPPIPPVSLN